MTPAVIRQVMPHCADAERWSQALTIACNRFGVTGKDSAAAFLGQIAHESRELTRLEEDLTYSGPRLMAVWPMRFPTLGDAAPYVRNPRALANRVYANRMGNGDEASGDGWTYRGRGPIQATGKKNYTAFFKALKAEMKPELLLTPEYGALFAAWFWAANGAQLIAHDGVTENEFASITRIVNGGKEGLRERMTYWKRAQEALYGERI